MKEEKIKKVVRESYGKIAQTESSCCAPVSSCCGGADTAQTISKKIGYTEDELGNVPEGANLGLGCGNPVALASLKEGETILDLGSGAGFDCFLAAKKVGKDGKVIGVDMTPEMVDKARENIAKGGYENIEFRLGEIENLPVADNAVDAIISNCVINLAPDKKRVFKEAFRVLKPGGRLMVSDMVITKELPDKIKESIDAYVGCISGALLKEEYLGSIKEAGFQDVEILDEKSFPIDCMANDPSKAALFEGVSITREEIEDIGTSIISVNVRGIKS